MGAQEKLDALLNAGKQYTEAQKQAAEAKRTTQSPSSPQPHVRTETDIQNEVSRREHLQQLAGSEVVERPGGHYANSEDFADGVKMIDMKRGPYADRLQVHIGELSLRGVERVIGNLERRAEDKYKEEHPIIPKEDAPVVKAAKRVKEAIFGRGEPPYIPPNWGM